MSTNMSVLDGFQKYLHSCALDESSLSIGRVNCYLLIRGRNHAHLICLGVWEPPFKADGLMNHDCTNFTVNPLML